MRNAIEKHFWAFPVTLGLAVFGWFFSTINGQSIALWLSLASCVVAVASGLTVILFLRSTVRQKTPSETDQNSGKAEALSPGQKWDSAKITAAMIGGLGAVIGLWITAVTDNAAREIAEEKATEVAEDIAREAAEIEANRVAEIIAKREVKRLAGQYLEASVQVEIGKYASQYLEEEIVDVLKNQYSTVIGERIQTALDGVNASLAPEIVRSLVFEKGVIMGFGQINSNRWDGHECPNGWSSFGSNRYLIGAASHAEVGNQGGAVRTQEFPLRILRANLPNEGIYFEDQATMVERNGAEGYRMPRAEDAGGLEIGPGPNNTEPLGAGQPLLIPPPAYQVVQFCIKD